MTQRKDRIAALLREEISLILLRDFKNPRLGFVTVTDAEVSADLSHAKVFVSIMGPEESRKESLGILRRAAGFFRQTLSRRLRMKTMPEIDFILDTSADKSIRIMELLEEIKRDDSPSGTD